jgi:hypothetical protein
MRFKPITPDELQGERPVKEWDRWLLSRLADIGSTREGIEHKRLAKGLMKKLKEEIIPTVRLLQRSFEGKEIFAAFPADNSKADAFIRPGWTTKATPLQITCNFDYDNQLRLESLQRDGRIPGFGPIARINGRVEAEGRAYFTQEVVDKITGSIIDRLNLKA